MPPPDADPWADLYADLGVGSQPAKPSSPFLPADDLDNVAGESPEEVTAAEPDPEMGGDGDGGGEEGELGEDGQPKRRRRRRRRRGGAGRREGAEGAEGEPEPSGGRPAPLELGEPLGAGFTDEGGEEGEDFDAPAPPPSPRRRQPVAAATQDDDGEDEGDFAGATQATVPTQAEWNVPSWAEIVRGLYRPDRHER